jgi:integrase
MWRGNLQIPKTKSAIRKVDISATLLLELKKWKLACPVSDDDLIFPSLEGCRVNHENAMNRHFHPLLRRAGIRHVSFHSLRHSNASLRIASGQNIKYISTQLGHSSVKITLDTYGHLFKDTEFTKQQVGLLESTLTSVRKPLETSLHDVTAAKEQVSKHLESNNISQGGHFAQIDLNCMTLK